MMYNSCYHSHQQFYMETRQKCQFCFVLILSPCLHALINKRILDHRLNCNYITAAISGTKYLRTPTCSAERCLWWWGRAIGASTTQFITCFTTFQSQILKKQCKINQACSSEKHRCKILCWYLNRPLYSCVLRYLAMNASRLGVDLALIQTSLLFSFKMPAS